MSKEVIFIRLVQIVISLNTLIFIYGIMQAKKGNIDLHKKINGVTALVTILGVIGLVITVILGFDYHSLTTPLRMTIHRSFASPLFVLLLLTVYFGWRENRAWHLRLVYITIPFWLGTFITGIVFFL